ncbi:PhzF family phenazine biosynthesis protein [Streptomyces sp. NBC_01803]|uniref:PhzF family phenazine biosynthesis protein n=1 Tax=Streptomyces sp. NBC_01803 TaxID=2975946 RepID=UPI002DD91063|nr:PhzF family phenazine biosynthesis isomerase [Streptomyces sp. NBC_01803]WSA46503.1 PhzF family phenazine biosynthesis protein [Streptomyces sp. NBC_01803]
MTSGTSVDVLRYTAFPDTAFPDRPAGGNPAGVVLDATGLDDAAMLAIAAEVGYSETVFLFPGAAAGSFTARYFSPLAEVPFCGHATVAAAVALARRSGPGELLFATRAGEVPVTVTEENGVPRATLSSVEPYQEPVTADDLAEALAALDWPSAGLDPALPPAIAFAGARHLVVAAATRERLAELDYDVERLAALMRRLDLTTVQLVWREAPAVFHVRDPFPVGGVVEDPATGAAAAALGGYLRAGGHVPDAATLTLHQGHDLGRPSLLTVTLVPGDPRVHVSGTAAPIPA